MQSKFDTLFESNFNRFSGGGFLTGDVIKLKQGWESDDWCKSAPAQLIEQLRLFAESDLVMRVSSVKTVRPAVNSSVDQAAGVDGFFLDITQEEAPGYWNGNFVTVPQHLVELNGPTDQLPEIPDSLKREENINIKPEDGSMKDTSDNEMSPKGDNYGENLPQSNTTLPGATAASSYTAGYMS